MKSVNNPFSKYKQKLSPFGHDLTSTAGQVDLALCDGIHDLDAIIATIITTQSKAIKISVAAVVMRHLWFLAKGSSATNSGITLIERFERLHGTNQAERLAGEIMARISGMMPELEAQYTTLIS